MYSNVTQFIFVNIHVKNIHVKLLSNSFVNVIVHLCFRKSVSTLEKVCDICV